MPGVKSPIGYAGGGELWIKSTPTPDANDNGKIKGADDAALQNPATMPKSNENYTKGIHHFTQPLQRPVKN